VLPVALVDVQPDEIFCGNEGVLPLAQSLRKEEHRQTH
jgi:hypothetical protein